MSDASSETLRERIFKAGLNAFANQGFVETSVDEIVAAAGTTKPMLYYYFGSKAGLYQAIATDAFGMLRVSYAAAQNPDLSPLDRLRAFVRADFTSLRDNPELGRFIYRAAFGAPRDAPPIDYWQLFMPNFSIVTQIVEAGQREGLIGPGAPPMLALPLFGLTSIFTQVHLGGPLGNMLSDENAELVVQLYLRGVAPKST
jgi:AcrR family transcriptional regulator